MDLCVRHIFEFLLDAVEANRYVLDRDAQDGGDFVVGHAFEPKQNDGAVEGLQAVDALVEQLDLMRVLVTVVGQVAACR